MSSSSPSQPQADDRKQDSEHDDAVEYIDGRAVDDWKHPWNLGDQPAGVGGFGKKHGIYYWALPFNYYPELSPYEEIRNISTFLQGRRATRRQVSRSSLNTASKLENSAVAGLEEITLLNGWWPGGNNRTTGDYYCNPEYPHPFRDEELLGTEPVYDEEINKRRQELARKAASLGLTSDVLARPFDVASANSVLNWCLDNDIQYSELRQEGLRKMARTYKTIHHWGVSRPEIAETFALPAGTLYSRLELVEDYDPPDEPSIPVFKDGGES